MTIPMYHKKGEEEMKYVQNYQDHRLFFELNQYQNPNTNPYFGKITDFIKIISVMLFGETDRGNEPNVYKNYKLHPMFEKRFVEGLNIESEYWERHNQCLQYYGEYMSKKKDYPYSATDKNTYFIHYYLFLHGFINKNYQLRNYIFFNKTLHPNGYYIEYANREQFTLEDFSRYMEISDRNFIQPSFEKDPLSRRFTTEYLIEAFV